jgi:DNA (cytosine-5)-methyltransferase 1
VIPVIDIFAGPGGLGEGFSSLSDIHGSAAFKIKLSLEKEEHAHRTLQLRAFYRNFAKNRVPEDYYKCLRGEITLQDLYKRHPDEAKASETEAVRLTLGEDTWDKAEDLIRKALNGAKEWVLIGGPPCQAYSIAGRARNKGIEGYEAKDDQRHFLYREYLKILGTFHPSVFVMENVKGLLSSKPEGSFIFEQIERDLKAPTAALVNGSSQVLKEAVRYKLYSLAAEQVRGKQTYVLRSELYGVPQTRHRVIIVGVREDLGDVKPQQLKAVEPVVAKAVLSGLPSIRSGLSNRRGPSKVKVKDSPEAWLLVLQQADQRRWFQSARNAAPLIGQYLDSAISNLRKPRLDRGGEYVACELAVEYRPDWFLDKRIGGVCNYSSRAHIEKDLYRYLYAACFAKAEGVSPLLRDFPKDLWPNHENVSKSVEDGELFEDRFRVQLADRPATTITSHISKDGHYYIHYDPRQCRSLTVREAARVQTFPDNYFFTGPRTAQYIQVGNAVPPLMAAQIARTIFDLFQSAGIDSNGSPR